MVNIGSSAYSNLNHILNFGSETNDEGEVLSNSQNQVQSDFSSAGRDRVLKFFLTDGVQSVSTCLLFLIFISIY